MSLVQAREYLRAEGRAVEEARSRQVAAVFFLLHEAPAPARRRILEEGLRLLKPGGSLVVCDIHPDFRPSPIMASGEP